MDFFKKPNKINNIVPKRKYWGFPKIIEHLFSKLFRLLQKHFLKASVLEKKTSLLLSHPNGVALWKPRDEEDGVSIVDLNGSIAVGLCYPKGPMKIGFLENQKERTTSLIQIAIF